jgi:hypothetical protein
VDPKIKIGDRVKLINPSYETVEDYPSLRANDEGIVCHTFSEIKLDTKDDTWKTSRKNYCIDWGKPIINGHNCDGRCEDGHGSCVGQEEIIKVL